MEDKLAKNAVKETYANVIKILVTLKQFNSLTAGSIASFRLVGALEYLKISSQTAHTCIKRLSQMINDL